MRKLTLLVVMAIVLSACTPNQVERYFASVNMGQPSPKASISLSTWMTERGWSDPRSEIVTSSLEAGQSLTDSLKAPGIPPSSVGYQAAPTSFGYTCRGSLNENNVWIVHEAASKYDWGWGTEWNSIVLIINGESKWCETAQNPWTSAFGLGQFLNSTWAGVGISKTTDPLLQAEAMMVYISGRYGTPSRAWAWKSVHGWY